jgi:hypothetical protein
LTEPLQFNPHQRYLPAAVSTCSCHLPRGAWGEHGWHWTRFGPADVERAVRKHLAEHASAPGSIDETRLRADLTKQLETYIGLPVAYAPCPHYRRAVRESQDRERARVAAKRGGLE